MVVDKMDKGINYNKGGRGTNRKEINRRINGEITRDETVCGEGKSMGMGRGCRVKEIDRWPTVGGYPRTPAKGVSTSVPSLGFLN